VAGFHCRADLKVKCTISPLGFDLPHQLWSMLNQFQTGQVSVLLICTDSKLHCPCDKQMMNHVVESCLLTKLATTTSCWW